MRDYDFDREIDEALARYAAVEPRKGFEQRVLANLQRADTRAERFRWRRLAVAAFVLTTVAAVLMISLAELSSRTNVTPEIAAQRPAGTGGSVLARGAALTKRQLHSESMPRTARAWHRRGREGVRAGIDAAPKLDQFPAPEPLTQQEKLLIQFVEQNPESAALFAELKAKELQRESDDMSAPVDGAGSQQTN
ncbi:MAG TPA: hypothetical protein VMB47_10175 [Candidatus Aquilonibacter sp.]|nr:hypothetical protein [Candidatus Aquilonibacter sp.]